MQLTPAVCLMRALSHVEQHLDIWPGSDSWWSNPLKAITRVTFYCVKYYYLSLRCSWRIMGADCGRPFSHIGRQTEPVSNTILWHKHYHFLSRLSFCYERGPKSSPGFLNAFDFPWNGRSELAFYPSSARFKELEWKLSHKGDALLLICECATDWLVLANHWNAWIWRVVK